MGEPQAFQVRLTANGRDTYTARSGKHDDPVLAVALAAWFGGRWPVVGVGHARNSQGTRRLAGRAPRNLRLGQVDKILLAKPALGLAA